MSRKLPPDHEARRRIVEERARNVLVGAGAGTGKTTTIVERLAGMVAPADDGPALPLERIAAITFTRKAAGELRLRLREEILTRLATADLSATRRERLSRAAAAFDTAAVGTIHSFADRLLRLRPVEARLSPSYSLVEDGDALVEETCRVLLHAAQARTLAQELAGHEALCDAARAEEAQESIRAALDAGLPVDSKEYEFATKNGLWALFAGFIAQRDVPPPEAPPAKFQAARIRALVEEFQEWTRGVGDGTPGGKWLRRTAKRLDKLDVGAGPATVLHELQSIERSEPEKMRKTVEFKGDPAAYRAWQAWAGDTTQHPARERPLRDDLAAPAQRWLATRLVRTFPAVIAAYEKVKARHRAVDQLDLLLRLRDLLRDDRAVRTEYQALFDHLFVDEFQDTDPLQAEIVLYLCEDGARAAAWQEVAVKPGKLTLVGDPKQSIYRFRRADIAVYDAVREQVKRGPCLEEALSANFRSEPALISFFNDRFDEVLGKAEAGEPVFDPAAGTVKNERLLAGLDGHPGPVVTVLPYQSADGKTQSDREQEGRALAAWLRSMVGEGEVEITDPSTGARRPAGYGDVAVLARSTWHLGLLFAPLDELGVPYSARGGTLFLEDPLHRQFLLALRALADRDDGVAVAALLRPPFFALDLGDLVAQRAAAPEADGDERVTRARAAQAFVSALRRERHARPAGDTARDLLERTAFGRTAALGPNGAQRLERLRELCLELERLSAEEGLDFDAATLRLREWAVEPVGFDPPRPVATEAVQVMSIHQAKGLEFPVVILWDGRDELQPKKKGTAQAWTVDREGESWALGLDGLDWEEPADAGVLEREQKYLDAERRRLVYVAATRARDRLLLPVPAASPPTRVTACLAAGEGPPEVLETFGPDAKPAWAKAAVPPTPKKQRAAMKLAREVEEAWSKAAAAAGEPRLAPAGVSAEAHAAWEPASAAEADPAAEPAPPRKYRPGRFGNVFGDTVHRAIGVALRQPALAPGAAVERARTETGLEEHLDEAADDVERALAALTAAGLRRPPGNDLRLEYPVAAAAGKKLLAGYVDLLSAADGALEVIDFKTDQPPEGDVQDSHPDYVAQVRRYGEILAQLGLSQGRTVRCGLLFTADGGLRWT
ncbi:UvrD-helicase domain-containing protein [Anaeromyxobacter paludicola]|uniref:DNA 3'-5' helicase n=1 Tax=Anaeromyxobacter paludicola TaxID=2918171 RepID=A0ABM7X9T2_9BACT|nr:UvrD-helicase domain-containing protein [Anaeromyxobacter paludicola]BDG08592.1 ATP-dependent DNA helicase [Anaeromyxobacter paludicola]